MAQKGAGMMTAHTPQGRERRHHPQINPPPPWTRNPLTKKREYNEELPPQLYDVTEQNDDVRADGIPGGKLLGIELWNMK